MIAGGLGQRGVVVTQGLNPYFEFKIAPVQDPACLCVDAEDAGLLLFDAEGQAFRPEVTSFHAEDRVECPEVSVLEPTGLEPQADPAAVFSAPVSGSAPREPACGPETVPTPTGLEPQPDPAAVAAPAASTHHAEDAEGPDTRTVEPSGTEPQPDAPPVARPKASGSERDRR